MTSGLASVTARATPWDLPECASLSTTPLIEGPQRFTEPTKFKVVCYDGSRRVVKRVLNVGPDAPEHWFTSEEPVALNERFGAYMETAVGQTIFTLSALALGYVAHQPLRAVGRTARAQLSRFSAVAAPIDEPVLDPKNLRLFYVDQPIAVSDLVVSPDMVPAWARWHFDSETGAKYVVQRRPIVKGNRVQPSAEFEAIRVQPGQTGLRRAERGPWAKLEWSEEMYQLLADPKELAISRPVGPPSTFALPGERPARTDSAADPRFK